MLRPTEELVREHRLILSLLERLEALVDQALAAPRSPPAASLHEVLALLCLLDDLHHGKEEDWLLPALERAALPRGRVSLEVTLDEHMEARALLAELLFALGGLDLGQEVAAQDLANAAARYARLMRRHMINENEVLFPLAETTLPGEAKRALLDGFAALERELLGGAGGMDALVARIDAALENGAPAAA